MPTKTSFEYPPYPTPLAELAGLAVGGSGARVGGVGEVHADPPSNTG
jgi:hypothetical protein